MPSIVNFALNFKKTASCRPSQSHARRAKQKDYEKLIPRGFAASPSRVLSNCDSKEKYETVRSINLKKSLKMLHFLAKF